VSVVNMKSVGRSMWSLPRWTAPTNIIEGLTNLFCGEQNQKT
jgi:hypothetical protein